LFIRKAGGIKPLTVVVLYDNDGGLVGTAETFIDAIGLSVKDKTMDDMEVCAGCHINDTLEEDGVCIPNQIY
jgi:hypothetical protein